MQDLAGFISQFMESELESNNLGFYLDLSQMLFFFYFTQEKRLETHSAVQEGA